MLPGTEGDNAVPLPQNGLPLDCRSQRKISFAGNILYKRPEQFQVLDNLGQVVGAKIVVRHELKMSFNLCRKISGKLCSYRGLQALALNLCLLVVRFLVRQKSRGLVKQFPYERFFPVRPPFRTRTLAIRQGKQHQCVQIFLMLHNMGEVCHGSRIIKISLLRDLGKGEVMINQEDEGLSLLGRQLQTRSDALSEECARFRVRPSANRFTAIVQKEREIKNKWILQFLKNLAIRDQFRVSRLRQGVKFIDAHQCVLVRCVTMQELMLHQAGKLSEFGKVAP